jgi:GTP-binding protein Era
VDEFKVRSADVTYIHATILAERSTQRGILLGRGGRMIKSISKAARGEIEKLLATRVYLELWVKVRPKWRQKDDELRRLGFQ